MWGVIYCYTSPSGKKYIGQTTNEKHRRTTFFAKGTAYSHRGSKIDNAIAKYGPENFIYEIFEEIDAEDSMELYAVLNDREMYYIEKYDTFKNGYNSCPGGMNHRKVWTEEERLKSSLSHRGQQPKNWRIGLEKSCEKSKKKVYKYNNRGELVGEYDSIAEAERICGRGSHVSDCCWGKIQQCKGFTWRFEKTTVQPFTCKNECINIYKDGILVFTGIRKEAIEYLKQENITITPSILDKRLNGKMKNTYHGFTFKKYYIDNYGIK